MAILDVEANFVVVSAYQYTSITSVMLLDCLSIPASMLLLRLCLGTRFAWRHLLAALVCLSGLAMLVVTDTISSAAGSAVEAEYPMKWLGDLLCVLSAVLYAMSNVGQEFLVRKFGSVDYLGTMGAFGVVVSMLQLAIFQRQETRFWGEWEWETAGLVAGFALSLFFMYILTARFLQGSDAALFNLSLLTSDVWAVLAAAVLFQQYVQPLYFVSLGLVATGLFMYHLGPDPKEAEAGGCFARLGFLGGDGQTRSAQPEGSDSLLSKQSEASSSDLDHKELATTLDGSDASPSSSSLHAAQLDSLSALGPRARCSSAQADGSPEKSAASAPGALREAREATALGDP
jgi:solute carrier family 35 protein F1/2